MSKITRLYRWLTFPVCQGTKRLPDNRFNDSLKLQWYMTWYTDMLCMYVRRQSREFHSPRCQQKVVRRHMQMRPDNFAVWLLDIIFYNVRFDDIGCDNRFPGSSVFLVQQYHRISVTSFYVLWETMKLRGSLLLSIIILCLICRYKIHCYVKAVGWLIF